MASLRILNFESLVSERFRRISTEGFWVLFGQASAIIGALVGVRLLTELLDPGSYGELALAMTAVTLIHQTVLGPLGNGVVRFYAPAEEKSDLAAYLSSVRKLVLSTTGVTGFMIVLSVGGLAISGHMEWIWLAIVALIFATLSGYNSILAGIQNAARNRKIFALHQGLDAWARFLVAAGFILLLGRTSTVAMIGYVVAIVMVLASQLAFFRKIILRSIRPAENGGDWQRQIQKFAWPIAVIGVFTWAQFASGRWALEIFGSTEDVGFYAALFQLGFYPISIGISMAIQFLAPVFYGRAGDATDSRRNSDVQNLSWRLTWLTLLATAVVVLLAYLYHEEIFSWLVASEYASVSYLLPWIVLSSGVYGAGQAIALNLMSQLRTKTMLPASVATASMGVVLNFVGAYLYGTSGIVIAGILFAVSHFAWMAMLARRSGMD